MRTSSNLHSARANFASTRRNILLSGECGNFLALVLPSRGLGTQTHRHNGYAVWV